MRKIISKRIYIIGILIVIPILLLLTIFLFTQSKKVSIYTDNITCATLSFDKNNYNVGNTSIISVSLHDEYENYEYELYANKTLLVGENNQFIYKL